MFGGVPVTVYSPIDRAQGLTGELTGGLVVLHGGGFMAGGASTHAHLFQRLFSLTAQDRSPFCIFHILNEILQHYELMDTFLVGNRSYIF